MKYYFLKLIPPRPGFLMTMTGEERAIMAGHQVYWRGFADKGWAVAYGPVADPRGGYGAGFWQLPDDQDPMALTARDPAIMANAGFRYEILAMPSLVIGTPI